MHADFQLHNRAATTGLTPEQAFGAVAAVVLVLFVVFAPTTAGMVETWYRSETFTHGFLVVPAVLWFVWARRAELARESRCGPRPGRCCRWPPPARLWLLGELSSSLAPSQLALVAMVPCVVAALFGWRWVRALAFPLAFLFFAVPFGEFLVPTLIDWTADFTVAALAASGIPVYREANNFVIPSGRWSVVEACSGIRYLIASVMLGSLYAWIVYRSPRKRALFIGAAILVPLVANWLRAYGIVMLGHLSDNRIATGVDHLIYGWIFFGALMAAMFWIGARWRDDDRARAARATGSAGRALAGAPRFAAGSRTARRRGGPEPGRSSTPRWRATSTRIRWQPLEIDAVNGWTQADAGAPLGWRPDVTGAARTQVTTFTKDGRSVSVVVAAYRNQRQGAELVTSSNQLVHQDNERWRIVDRGTREVTDAGGSYRANVALIRGPGGLLAAAQWYWLGSTRTVSDAKAEGRPRARSPADAGRHLGLGHRRHAGARKPARRAGRCSTSSCATWAPSIQHGLTEMARR